jgi:hypothetical protein
VSHAKQERQARLEEAREAYRQAQAAERRARQEVRECKERRDRAKEEAEAAETERDSVAPRHEMELADINKLASISAIAIDVLHFILWRSQQRQQ